VLHLQPMQWKDGWPVMGQPGARPETGNPVAQWRKPVAGQPPAVPASSDEFGSASLGYQWQWNANPQPEQYSLSARPGWLRLPMQPAPAGPVRGAANILTQKLPAPAFTVDTRIELKGAGDGDRAGFIMNALSSAWLGLRQHGGRAQLVFASCTPAPGKPGSPQAACSEQESIVLEHAPAALFLRLQMKEGGQANFYYSQDGQSYAPAGAAFQLSRGRWVGAQMGLFSIGAKADRAYLDVDYFRVRP
jgi:beta-xylosidase